jgi:hypothetical protein
VKRIRVQYDAYNRQFKLLDRAGANLQDSETYIVLDTASLDFDSDLSFAAEQELQTM